MHDVTNTMTNDCADTLLASIAQAAHEVNRAYCQAIGDNSQPVWDEAPEWQRASAMAGTLLHLRNPAAGPEASHESWMEQKLADGWVYGPEKRPDLKQHPCMVPFFQLSTEQKAKDYLFRAVVHATENMARAANELQAVAKDAEIQQAGALWYIAAMAHKFGADGVLHLTAEDMKAAESLILERADDPDGGVLIRVSKEQKPQIVQHQPVLAKVPTVIALDTSLPPNS